MAKHFSVNSFGKFLIWHEASRWVGEQASGFLPSDTAAMAGNDTL